jgi:hypothetical protein
MTFIGKVGEIVVHLNEAHFNQCPEIVRADRRQFCPPALDVAQYPAEMDRSLHTQARLEASLVGPSSFHFFRRP